jgi:uncharacterized protein
MDLEDLEERMNRPRSNTRWVGWLFAAAALVGSTFIATRSWVDVKTRIVRTIEVTGSAKRRITSDLIQWTATISAEHDTDRVVAYRALANHVQKTLAYLKSQGVKESELQVSAVETTELSDNESTGSGDNRVERQVFKGYKTVQRITVSSGEVVKIERVSREVTRLMETGVPVASSAPDYFYTKLGELKIEMLAEAAKDARTRAERMLAAAGNTTLGPLRMVNMGVINVNPPNSTATSWEGKNDTSTLEKDIITIVHCTFDVASR